MRKIGTWPIANTSGDTLEVRAFSYPVADLSADDDEPKIQDEWTDGIVFYAVWRLFHIYGHAKREWRQKALEHKALYREVVNEYNIQTSTSNEEPGYVLDAYEDFD